MPKLDGTGPRCGKGKMNHEGCENKKQCCRKNYDGCRETEYTRDDYLREKEMLEKRLEEVNRALDNKEE